MTVAVALSPSRPDCTPGGSGEPSPANGRGALLCLVSAAGFGVAAVFAKESYGAGLNVPTMLAVRFAVAAAVFWALVAWRRPQRPVPRTVFAAIGLGSI